MTSNLIKILNQMTLFCDLKCTYLTIYLITDLPYGILMDIYFYPSNYYFLNPKFPKENFLRTIFYSFKKHSSKINSLLGQPELYDPSHLPSFDLKMLIFN